MTQSLRHHGHEGWSRCMSRILFFSVSICLPSRFSRSLFKHFPSSFPVQLLERFRVYFIFMVQVFGNQGLRFMKMVFVLGKFGKKQLFPNNLQLYPHLRVSKQHGAVALMVQHRPACVLIRSLHMQVLLSFNPPNVGVAGPTCWEGKSSILTHDFTHRSHQVRSNLFINYISSRCFDFSKLPFLLLPSHLHKRVFFVFQTVFNLKIFMIFTTNYLFRNICIKLSILLCCFPIVMQI